MLGLAGLPWAVLDWSSATSDTSVIPPLPLAMAMAVSSALILGSVWLDRFPFRARQLLSLAAVGVPAVAWFAGAPPPPAFLALLLLATGFLALLWGAGWLSASPAGPVARTASHDARNAAGVSLALWLAAFLAIGRAPELRWPSLAALAWAWGWTLYFAVVALGARQGSGRRGRILFGVALAITAAVAAFSSGGTWSRLSGAPLVSVAVLLGVRRARSSGDESAFWWEPLLVHPERLLVGTFALLSVVGTLVLALPVCGRGGHPLSFIDAAFTAVSAVCVTGLTARDTATAFSSFGQFAILVLIQVGGLGIMTFSTAAIRMFGRRMSLRHEGAVASLMSASDRRGVFSATQRVLAFTFGCELVGAILLLFGFLAHGDSVGTASWRAVFTAISAFCNAGFAIQSDSLIGYQHSAYTLHVVGCLIIAGGLSPAVALALPSLRRRGGAPVFLQAKIALWTTASLLSIGFVTYLAMEWNVTLRNLSLWDRIHNAWFQSVTLRTAGFNSVDLTICHPATIVVMMLLMFIGGSPGGTAGGIKTTTLAVLAALTVSTVLGKENVELFRRTISPRTIHKAAVVLSLGALSVIVASLAMLLTQSIPPAQSIFEVVSALGTVGLTIGATPQLDGAGKIIIITCMFMGRVGALSVFLFLSDRMRRSAIRRPEEDVDVG